MWKPFVWIWVTIIVGIGINVGSSWLTTQTTTFTLHGTPLGWVVDPAHTEISLPLIGALIFFTGLAGLAHHQARVLTVPAAAQSTITLQQRLWLIRSFRHEYSSWLAHSLQGRVAIELGLHERTNMVASSAQIVFRHTDTATEYPLPSGTSIIQVYDQTQRGLLILGAPGSGKTTLLLHLVGELLQRAESDPDLPIPIILNLSSWAEKKLALVDWFCEQCALIYSIPKRNSASWIASDQILFLLDGLDEVEASVRPACIEAINLYREEHLVPLVVCSRSQDYEDQQERLILPIAIEIQPLEVTQTAVYLKQAGKSVTAVRAALRANTTLQQLITTPLMLTIVLLTYRDMAVKDLPQMGSPEDQQRQIFAHYVEHMLEQRTTRGASTPQQTQHWLIWLAQTMRNQHLTEFYLEQLQPTWLSTKRSQILYRMLTGLLLLGLTGALVGTLIGLLYGAPSRGLISICALFGALLGALLGKIGKAGKKQEIRPADILKWTWKNAKPWLIIGPIIGLGIGLVGGLIFGLPGGLVGGLIFALVITSVAALLGGLSGEQINKDVRIHPNQGTRSSGWNALRFGLAIAVVTASSDALIGWPLLKALVVALAIGLLGGLAFGGSAYLEHYLLRYFLWRQGAMPLHYVLFLEEAHERILLQRVGGGYRFIHPLFQEYFASLTTSPTTP